LGRTLCGGGRPLWVHGSSVGEVQSALAVLAALRTAGYDGPLVLSAATPAGLETAQKRLAELAPPIQLMAPPLDFWGAPANCLDRLNPRGLALVETELWPELIFQCARRSIPVMTVAGRLSERSFRRLSRFRRHLAPLLSSLALFAAIGPDDAERFAQLSGRPERTRVLGSPKFDALMAQAAAELAELNEPGEPHGPHAFRQADEPRQDEPNPAGPSFSGPVAAETTLDAAAEPEAGPLLKITAGSTHPGEEELILAACRRLAPGSFRLVLAPRHLGRVPDVLTLAERLGFQVARLSEAPAQTRAEVAVVDRLGLLARLYKDSDLAVVGGSFPSGSGHNPLEPAAYGRPVIFGPHMSSFAAQADRLVDLGAARRVGPGELAEALAAFAADPEPARQGGRRGQAWLAAQKPVAPALARAVLEVLASR
jgi:3-deoxy-D-manno-octulosonic-acid transferase